MYLIFVKKYNISTDDLLFQIKEIKNIILLLKCLQRIPYNSKIIDEDNNKIVK